MTGKTGMGLTLAHASSLHTKTDLLPEQVNGVNKMIPTRVRGLHLIRVPVNQECSRVMKI